MARRGRTRPYARVLVTDAGTGASNNLVRSLRRGADALFIAGCQDDQFYLKASTADRNFLVPPASHPGFADAIRRIVDTAAIDLILPNSDAAVRAVSEARALLPCRVFLPDKAVIERCQDKLELTRFLAQRRIPAPRTLPVSALGDLERLFGRFRRARQLWCRIRVGSGSHGAAPVRSPAQARSWIKYWYEMRGVSPTSFTLSEYLPGRDFACQSLWKDGRLLLVKTCERLSYFEGGSQPSGRSSIAGLARTVREPRVVDVSARAIRALDPRASGAFSVDLKEDAGGVPCITEINAGRFITLMNLFDLTGRHNMADTYVRIALDRPVTIRDVYDAAPDHYFVRNVDAEPVIFPARQFFVGIEDMRVSGA
jgi:hypothetical protein